MLKTWLICNINKSKKRGKATKNIILVLILIFLCIHTFADINDELIAASKSEDVPILKQLVIQGADVNFKDENGETVLIIIIKYHNRYTTMHHLPPDFELIKMFITYGADLNVKDKEGKTAFFYAYIFSYHEIAQLLLDSGAEEQISVVCNCSSELEDQNITKRYSANKAFDNNPLTSWVEGARGDGIGENVALWFREVITIDSIKIMPGYFDANWYSQNNRVKRLKIQFDEYTFYIDLDDGMKEQEIMFDRAINFKMIKFFIEDIYKGSHYRDTCIAEIKLYYKGKQIFLVEFPVK